MAATAAEKAAARIKESLHQYSKKMCSRVTIFWMLYRVACLIAVFINPNLSVDLNRLTERLDAVQIVNMSVYTVNSTAEKIAVAFVSKKVEDEEEEENNG